MSSTHSPHLLFSPKKKSNSNENNHSFSYEVISTLESTGVHFRTSIDPGSYVPAHLHHAIEIIYLLEGNLTVIMESSVREYHAGVKAEKREQPQKKPSILKKLDEYKKQAAQQPKDNSRACQSRPGSRLASKGLLFQSALPGCPSRAHCF